MPALLSTFARSLVAILSIVTAAGCATTDAPLPPSGQKLSFVTHAAFFSQESHQPNIIDPQVFVMRPGAPAATGPQNISHVEDLRNATPSDAAATQLFSAAGKPLGITVGQWFFAGGSAILHPLSDGREQVYVSLHGLKPNGVYSLFENHFDQQPVGFTPLDGTAATNTFFADADGNASHSVVVPRPLTHDNAVLLVYHSDGDTHGLSRGTIGVDAHHQLIVRIP